MPFPIGSTSATGPTQLETVMYEYVPGQGGHPLELPGQQTPVNLDEWDPFEQFYALAGLRFSHTDPDYNYAISSNLVIDMPVGLNHQLPASWKLIYFGPRSVFFNTEKLTRFLNTNKGRVEDVIGKQARIMLHLVLQYLTRPQQLTSSGVTKLTHFVDHCRLQSLRAYCGTLGATVTSVDLTESEHLPKFC
ncbi:MAG: hypothetical protein UY09_C0034G0004 [Parcubacteria group bacterium GW2011_GWA2_47_8]|nr:MAG: hypothetical protein UY09_C0034G0004 [Parcubacteria group bacterium GW2011_GWA2_47_8]